MKRLIFLLICCLTLLENENFISAAETIYKDGTTWVGPEKQSLRPEAKYYRTMFKLSGNVEINGNTYLKLWMGSNFYNEEEEAEQFPVNSQLVNFIREEDGRIYQFDFGFNGGEDYLIYDFNLKEGDTTTIDFGNICLEIIHQHYYSFTEEVLCYATGSVSSCGHEYSTMTLRNVKYLNQPLEYVSKVTWIAGIGSPKYMPNLYDNVLGILSLSGGPIGELEYEYILVDGKEVFRSPDFSAVNNINAKNEECISFTLNGRQAMENEPGVRISNGEKHVVF